MVGRKRLVANPNALADAERARNPRSVFDILKERAERMARKAAG